MRLLNVDEKLAVACFKQHAVNPRPEEEKQASLASQALKRHYSEMEERAKRQSEYIDLKYIPSTSVVAESSLSVAKYVLSDHRRRMSPVVFNQILFLKLNRRFWNQNVFSLATNDAVPVQDDDDEVLMPEFPDVVYS